MTERIIFKNNLRKVDKETRMCLLYLKKKMNEQFKIALQVKQPKIPKADFSKTESQLDSLQKQIDGLRVKVDTAWAFTKEYDSAEIFLKNLIVKADQVLGEVKLLFDELYKSGFFKEGQKRRIRDEGLLKDESLRKICSSCLQDR